MKRTYLILIIFGLSLAFSCGKDDPSLKAKIDLVTDVTVLYPTSSLSNYSLRIDYNEDNTIHSVLKTFADNSTMQFECRYTTTKKLAGLTIEMPTGAMRSIAFNYTPQDILFEIAQDVDGGITTYQLNYNASNNNYTSANKTWFFDARNNFEGYLFMSEVLNTFEINDEKGLANLETYIPALIYETLSGVGFASDLNCLSPNQITKNVFEELSATPTRIEYRYNNALDAAGNLGTITTYVGNETSIFSTKTFTYETRFQ